ncbi:MAG: hypothetical protein M1813_006345 [Trichoglossum hirsutum]|nr:MAG: hypothetical protein M1813_006345 [Trichoglossum hirsutum]
MDNSQSPFVDLPNAITFVQAWNYTCQIQALVPRNPLLLSAASAKLRRVSSRERSWTGPLVGLPAGLGVEVSAEVSAEAPVEVPSEVPAEGKVRHHTEPSAEPSAEHSKQIIRGIQVFLRRRERLMGIRNHVLTPFETYFNGYSSPAPPGAYYSANPSPAPSGAYYSANPSPAPSGAYYSANPSPAPSGAYYSANPSPAPSGAYYSANPSPAPIETSIGTLETITELSARAEMAATEFEKLLQERSIVQDLEWSNKGQHVEFEPYESPPLEVVEPIAFSLTARVDKVKCRRIFLARKLLTCNRRLKLADAIVEVEHLQRLRHAHIVQLIGSYIQGRDFAILLYPCANMNLQDFMKPMEWKFLPNRIYALVRFFLCLANGLTYIHAMTTKHMDIKPLNLLVKWRPTKRDSPMNYCIYIADFGISRSFSPIEHSVDEGPISRSKIYCAPEVYNYDKRGRSADVFSLGCVFYEMLTVLSRARLNEFVDHRCGDGEDDSFHANIERVKSWGVKLRAALLQQDFARRGSLGLFIHWLDKMLDADPSARPKATVIAEKLTEFLGRSSCCDEGPEKYVDESVNPPPKFCM